MSHPSIQALQALNHTLEIANAGFSKQVGLLGQNLERRLGSLEEQKKGIFANLTRLERSAFRRARAKIKGRHAS